ncbi:outer membrane beta-barrel family protein [Maribacter aestuarii]|uniref:outer membrane beta-barrel family protein n=1 Tax=Maribacter aestuarii TaxID=1130723 RepID=UPI00248B3DC4|nr:outer membrane beta-barrel family protein [Maribacter aestuarii]
MKPLLLFLIVILGFFQEVSSQTFLLSGEVRDERNEVIPFASVFLLRTTDSTLVKGTSADELGVFTIQDITPNLYFLRASYIGRTSASLAIDIAKDTKIGALIIEQKAEELNEVIVTANRPQVERKVDRLIFNVENTVLSQSSSWEILQQTPGVISMQDELQIRNQAAVVYINDRKVQLSAEEIRSLLENYQGANIKSVEVIPNPPSNYDAEGGAVLNIVTSKNISLGYKGNVTTNYTQAIFPKYSFGTSHFYKTKKLNLNTSYSYVPRKDFKNTESIINFINDTGIFSRWDTDFDKTNRFRTHNAGLVIDYEINKRNELNFTTNAQLSPERTYNNFQDTQIRNTSGVLDSTFTTSSFLDENKNNISGDLTFKHRFKENGGLTLNGHYTQFDFTRTQDANSTYFEPDGNFIRDFNFFTDANQDIEIVTAQMDYTNLLGTVGVEAGIKGSFINSESKLDYFDQNNGSVLDPNLSDNFLYDETVYAGYLSLSKDWEKWSLKTGLRAEHTQSSGTSIALSTINNLEYFELFPTLYLLHNIHENHSVAFDYSRKLTRPRYEDLNPFRTFINENIFYEGNPNLPPSFSNNFNLNYTLKQEFFFDFYYRDNGEYISTLSFQDNENQILRDVTQNVLESTSYGFDFNYGKSISNNWYLYSYVSIFHEDETFLALESDALSATNEIDGLYLDITNYLTLSKDGTFKGELGLTYLSGFLQGSYIIDETTNLTLGLRKSFWNRRALVSISANDILGKANSRVTSKYLNQDNNYLAVPETQYVRFGFTYNFGNFRLEDNQREIDKIERDRLRAE